MADKSIIELLRFRSHVENARDAVDAHRSFNTWVREVGAYLTESGYPATALARWAAVSRSVLVDNDGYHDYPEAWASFHGAIDKRLAWLAVALEEHEAKVSPSAPSTSTDADSLQLLHPEIAELARSRIESGHLADAVEAALKHINTLLKQRMLRLTGRELDGAELMNTIFSPNRPVLALADLSSASGRNEQVGYMQIFAGAMTGVRNPKAHANVEITRERALHLLFLGSLLRYKIDECVDVVGAQGTGSA